MRSFILLSACLSLATAAPGTSCVLSTEHGSDGDFDNLQPLIVTVSGQEILYPERDERIVKIARGQSILLVCAGESNSFKNLIGKKQVTAICVASKTFTVNAVAYQFSALTCTKAVESTARRTEVVCLRRHTTIEIGFQWDNRFLRIIEICRDDDTYETYYTKFNLLNVIGSAQRGVSRPKWRAGNFFGELHMEDLYNIRMQIKMLATILRIPETEIEEKYIKPSEKGRQQQFLSRGHLTAKGDFVYSSQQGSTFWYLNAAPQWVTTNSGNWNDLERNVRQFAANRMLDLNIYTGTHGIMELPDARGTLQPIYMKFDRSKAMPVPELFWKVIYDPVGKKGTAFLGSNNPFIHENSNYMFLCADISSRLNWLTWNSRNITAGISYACDVNDARRNIPTIPKLFFNIYSTVVSWYVLVLLVDK